jgi:PQQ-dependent dehydrogenase (methanol/ethanol family)
MRRTHLYTGTALAAFALPVLQLLSAQTSTDFRRPSGKDWPLVGGDWGNTRFSTLSQIDPSNVKTLKGAWMTRLNSGFGPGFSQQATPVVRDGVLYITTGEQDVFALDGRTGRIVWEYRTTADPRTPDNKAKRGVGVGEGLVFGVETDIRRPAASGPTSNIAAKQGAAGTQAPGGRGAARQPGIEPVTRLIALDQKTGKVRWKQEVGEDIPGYQRKYITAPPLYYNGLVYATVSGGDGGLRGRITAHEARTGKEVWRFYTVPGPGEFGNDTWEGDSWKTGGAAVWTQPALDPDLGLIYINTGNPWPSYNGSSRAGDNLFSCAIVALDAKTGKYRWHYQVLRHDIWDFDPPTPLILFDQSYAGQMRKGIASHTKHGWVYILDRVTGEPLTPVEEKPVPQEPRQKTARTQPVPIGDPTAPQCAEPVKGFVRGCMFTPFWNTLNIAQPSASADWAPGAYDPRTGRLFFAVGVSTRVFRAGTEEIVDGRRVSRNAGRYGPIGTREYGLITALDSRTNRHVWQKEMPHLIGFGSGVLATAGGLLFHGGPDGYFLALDSNTGEELWRFQTGFGADAPAAAYQIDGEQYVAIASGGSRDGFNEARGDLVWAFKLGGRVNPLNGPPPPPTTVTFDTTGPLVKSQTITIGRRWDVRANRPGERDEYDYGPKRTVVPLGSEVTFVNDGDMDHTATDQGGTWDTGVIAPGQKITLKFEKPGEFIYFCLPHPWMLGQLIVQ